MLADRYFVRNLKLLMLLCFLALGLTFGFIIFTMPPPPFLNSGTSVGVRFGPGGEYLSLFAVSLSGLFAGMTATPALELLAEAQTLSEGASANLVMFGIQIFAIIVTYLTNILATQGLSVVLCVSVFCCIVVLLFVTQHGQSAPLAVPQLGSCASSGRALRLWAVSALPGRCPVTEIAATASGNRAVHLQSRRCHRL